MKQFFLTMAGVFAGLLLFFIGVPFVIIGMIAAASKPAPPPSNTLLSLDLRQAIVDQDNSAGFSADEKHDDGPRHTGGSRRRHRLAPGRPGSAPCA